ncbi:hypothetical protein DNTS_017032, partial [Danionella cerebrum]
RRLISQRSSLETLEDIEENAPLRRCRTLSGSPRPKSFKKVHFIKNIRQHDMRNGRIVLISGRRSFYRMLSGMFLFYSLKVLKSLSFPNSAPDGFRYELPGLYSFKLIQICAALTGFT